MRPSSPRKILVLQMRASGDTLLALPALRLLRESFPGARLDFLSEAPHHQALLGTPHVDRVILYDRARPLGMLREIRREGYDWAIDFFGNPRSALLTAFSGAPVRAGYARVFHRWAYNRRYVRREAGYVAREKIEFLRQVFGLPGGSLVFDYRLPTSSRARALDFLSVNRRRPSRPLVTMAPAARPPYKRWRPERWAAVIDWLQERIGADVLLLWAPKSLPSDEEGYIAAIGSQCRRPPLLAPGTPTLSDLAAFLERADLHVGADNAAAHVAAAAGRKTVTLYGPGHPLSWTHPDRSRHLALKKSCLCDGVPGRKESCRERACWEALSVDEVERTIIQLLAAGSSDPWGWQAAPTPPPVAP